MNTWLNASDSSSMTDKCMSCSCVKAILLATGTLNGATDKAQGLSCGGSWYVLLPGL